MQKRIVALILAVLVLVAAVLFFLNRNGNHKVNWMADTIVIGDILRNLTHTSPNSRIFADEALLIT